MDTRMVRRMDILVDLFYKNIVRLYLPYYTRMGQSNTIQGLGLWCLMPLLINISVILVEETGVTVENNRHAASR